jgi:YHS domain-containing protein
MLGAAPALAEDGHKHEGPVGVDSKEGAKAVDAGNKICPVSGEKLGSMGEIIQHEHNGKVYNFCCKACAKDFKKAPEKYIKIVEDEIKAQAAGASGEGKTDHDHGGHK